MTPDVSIVIPTAGRSHLLATTLHCALNQTDVDVEVIVVDDASTDDTARLLKRYDDDRVRVLRNEVRRGVSAARNRGVEHARGRWIAFLDDDDLWAPNKLAYQLEAAEDSARAWAYSGDVNVDTDLNVLSGSPPRDPARVVRDLDRYNSVPSGGSNVVVRSDVLTAVGPFDPSLTNSEDWDMWIRLARDGPPAWVRSPFVAYAVHQGSASHDMVQMLDELDAIGARHGITVDRAAHLRLAAWTHLLEGDSRAAINYYVEAIRCRDLLSAVRLLVAILVPGVARRRSEKQRRRHSAWTREAMAWLGDLQKLRASLSSDDRT
jgi:glycosyltransferase involved in cell wall biosynthesis